MRTVFFVVVCLISLPFVCMSQEGEKKSSSKSRKESYPAQFDELLNEATLQKDKAPQRALELVKEALALSMIREDTYAESRCYNLLGEINMGIEEWKLALDNFTISYSNLSRGKIAAPSAERNKALYGLGRSHLKLGNYQEAHRFLDELRRLRIDPALLAETELDLSEVYYQTGRYDEALSALDRLQKSSKSIGGSLLSRIENQRARIYARTNQVEESYKRLQASQNILRSAPAAKPSSQEAELRVAKDELSEVLQEQKRYDEKIELLNSSIEFNQDVSNYGEVAKDKVELGKTLSVKGEREAALRALQEAAVIADTIGDAGKQASALLSLARMYDQYGNDRAALNAYSKYSEAVARNEARAEQRLTEKSELIRTQRDIEELSKSIAVDRQEQRLAAAIMFRQKIVIYGLIALVLVIGITSYFIYRNALASKIANQMLALKSLRSQMNPHFIFNALNSVNHFVSQNDERTANKFLSEFSRLMRLVMENSQQDFIPLFKEEEIISLYLKLEHYRFRDKFDYEISVDDGINKENVEIPPMLIQPYIENAVWHGLRYKETKGLLTVSITQQQEFIHVEITDNGIGRKRSAELKTENQKKHQSTGLRNIRERLGIINKVYKTNYKVDIADLDSEGGTRVTLLVPLKAKSE